ncbi:MAG: hypothetical protein AAF376_18695 [Pseudomonadota bacterium]
MTVFRSTALAFASAYFLTSVFAAPVAAQCVPSGLIINCTGTDTTGIEEDIDGLTVIVAPGADITVADDAVVLDGDDNTLTNSGTIASTGSGDEGVQSDGDNFTLINIGTITSDDDDGVLAEGDGAAIVNSGTITSEGEAIRTDGDMAIITNTGAITSNDNQAIEAEGAGSLITNSGTITSATEGVEAQNEVVITNAAGGTITGEEDGVQFGDGLLINALGATITGGSAGGDGDGVDVDFGRIENHGTIQSLGTGSAAIDVDEVDFDDQPITELLTIVNSGTISGEIGILVEPDLNGGANETQQVIRNSGTISALSGPAMTLAAGDDSVWLETGSITMGDILLGAGEDTLSVASGIFVGAGDLFDGGEGLLDLLDFSPDLLSTDATINVLGGGLFAVGQITFLNFERLAFADGLFALSSDGSIAPVPLPAGLPLLLAGLGGFAALRLRARRAQS